MLGDVDDLSDRLWRAFPQGWIPRDAPVFSAVLTGLAWALAFFYQLLGYVRLQTRVLTASDGFLDLMAGDFFGDALPRQDGESDSNYRTRILAQMFRERATRRALVNLLTQLTGVAPSVIEPSNPADTGALGKTLALGLHGCVGSLNMPYQAFVTVYRNAQSTVPNVPGLGDAACGLAMPAGAVLIAASSMQSIYDRNIYAAIDAVKPVGTTVWTRIVARGA